MDDALIVPVVLFVQYAAVGVYVCGQIGLLLYQRHRPCHYKAVFNWFALSWMLLRSVFWALTAANVTWNSFLQNFVFWLPTCLNFLTFATLALFLAKGITSADTWRTALRPRLVAAFGLCAVADVAGSATLAALAVAAPDDDAAQRYVNADAVFTSALFAVLGGCFVYIGFRLRRLKAWEFNRLFLFLPGAVACSSGGRQGRGVYSCSPFPLPPRLQPRSPSSCGCSRPSSSRAPPITSSPRRTS